jgi:hypothetical protein
VISKRGQHYFLVIGFLFVAGAMGPFQAISELREGETPQALDLFRQAPTVANLRSFEKDLEGQSVVSQAVRPPMQYLRFQALGDTGEKALVGRQNWWFYRPDVRYLTERCPDNVASKTGPRAAVSAMVAFRDQLARRGIRLLVVPAPVKPAVYPEMLTRRAVACDPRLGKHTREVMTELTEAGVQTVDLSRAFAEGRKTEQASDAHPWYLARDTHWTNQGARLAARAVASKIRSLGWATAGSVHYDPSPTLVRRPGDILQMLKCPPIEALFEPEDVLCERILRQDDGEPYVDDPEATILVMGDSFLRIYEQDEPGSAGFIAHLARELGQPVASIVNDGGASTLVRQELARRAHLLNGKRLVVWEFVERDIKFGMEGWQSVPLPPYDSADAGRPSDAPSGS